MLSTLLSSLQTSLGQIFSKPFVVGSVMPILLFVGACLGLAIKLGGRAGTWATTANQLLGPTPSFAWTATAGLMAIIAVSMIWSGLNGFLLEVLEGKHLGMFASILYTGQVRKQDDVDNQIQRYARDLKQFEEPLPGAAAPEAAHYQLKAILRDAMTQGKANQHPCYPRNRFGRLSSFLQSKHGMREVWAVRWLRTTGQVNTLETIKLAVDALANELRMGSSKQLAFDHVELLSAIDDSRERLRFEWQRLVNLRQFTYPTVSNANRGETSLRVLAPTRLGNLTRTMRSYALDRYGIDLDIFWTRLQRELLKESLFNATVSDAKTQVDFQVSLFFLTVIFTLFWSGYCLWVQPSPVWFLLITALGPIGARLLYLSTCQNYLVFADLMRSSVDHFRFALLNDLHILRPPGNREEVIIWRLLGGWMGYGNDVDVTFTGKDGV